MASKRGLLSMMDSGTSFARKKIFKTRVDYDSGPDALQLWLDGAKEPRPYRSWTMDSWDRIQAHPDENNRVLGYTVCPLKKLVAHVEEKEPAKLWNALGVPQDELFEVDGQVLNFVELVHWAAKRFGAE